MAHTWRESATKLNLPVRDRRDHEQRWLDSLSPFSAYVGARVDPECSPTTLLAHALDAAVGVALATERLQRSCLGPVWERRLRSISVQAEGLALRCAPPPGCDAEGWSAIRAVMMADIDADNWAAVAKVLPEEVELLRRLQEGDPGGYQRLVEAAAAEGARIDQNTRRDAETRYEELKTGAAFRLAWTAYFGKARIRPSAPAHLAVHLLDSAGMESARHVALFLHHVGLLQASVQGSDAATRADSLLALDNEVYNARQALKRLRKKHLPGPAVSAGAGEHMREALAGPDSLIRTVEWVTWEDLNRLKPPPGRPVPGP